MKILDTISAKLTRAQAVVFIIVVMITLFVIAAQVLGAVDLRGFEWDLISDNIVVSKTFIFSLIGAYIIGWLYVIFGFLSDNQNED